MTRAGLLLISRQIPLLKITFHKEGAKRTLFLPQQATTTKPPSDNMKLIIVSILICLLVARSNGTFFNRRSNPQVCNSRSLLLPRAGTLREYTRLGGISRGNPTTPRKVNSKVGFAWDDDGDSTRKFYTAGLHITR